MGGLLTSFQQGIHDQSSTKKHRLGTIRIEDDGRIFRYAKAGGTLLAGQMTTAAPGITNHIKQTVAAAGAAAVGDKQVNFTLGGTVCTASQYDDGWLQVYDGAAGTVGTQYRISSHGVSAAGSEAISVSLREPIRVAIISTDTWSLIPNPWSVVIQSAAAAEMFAGVPSIAVTSGYYFWDQMHGEAVALNKSVTALGTCIELCSTAGAFITAGDFLGGVLGQTYGYAAADGKYCPIFLTA